MVGGISIVSDIHIKKCHDPAYNLLMSFFRHPLVRSSGAIYLLGDVFDCMLGRHQEYLKSYSDYFHEIGTVLKAGKEVHYLQGNHDIHVEQNYREYFRQHQIRDNKFIYHVEPFVKSIWGKFFFFAHGDEVEVGNWAHKAYRTFVTSSVMRFLAENIISYNIVHDFIEPFSERSRKRGQYYNTEDIRKRFRETAMKQGRAGYDYIVFGHSHVKDEYFSSGDQGSHFTYLNNGYFLDSESFIYLKEGQHSFVNLSG